MSDQQVLYGTFCGSASLRNLYFCCFSLSRHNPHFKNCL